MKDFGEILPVDAYKAQLTNSLPSDYLASLIHLYQPLIGIEATQLYQFLLLEATVYPYHTIQTHHMLMTYFNLPLDVIYRTRLKLEAFGLLKTYRHETDDKKVYTYDVIAPFSPNAFLDDAILPELLYREIGETKFASLKQLYQKKATVQHGTNITASFEDVFQTVEPQSEKLAPAADQPVTQGIHVEKMNFTYIQQVLLNKMIPAKKVLTEKNKRIISQTREIYQLDQYEIEKSLLWALTEDNQLDIEQFKGACNDLFRAKYNHLEPKLETKKAEPVKESSKPVTRTERLTRHLEAISPKELLEDLSAGKNASAQDLKMINDMIEKQGLSIPVMNVAIYYCLLQSNMRLSKAYLEKIVSHWSRLGFTTARQAMAHAIQEIQPKDTTRKQRRTYQQKQPTNEVIPDWFEDSKRSSASAKPSVNQTETLDDEERDEMLAILKRHASRNDS